MAVTIVVPAFNSGKTPFELVRRLGEVLPSLSPTWEAIFVDDGSSDGTPALLAELAAECPNVRVIRLARNFGQHSALLCGIRAAQYDVIVTMDDDLQNPPDQIPKLLAALDSGADVVYGYASRRRDGRWRGAASWLTRRILQGVMGVEAARHVSAFRAFRTPLREAFAAYSSPFVSIDVLLTWGTARFAAVPVHHDARMEGCSNYTLRRLLRLAVDMATGFSALPLRLASWVGFAFTVFGFAVLCFVVASYLYHNGSVLPGFPFLASMIALFSGAQLFALGLLGEYLARTHFRTMGQPAYVVRDANAVRDERPGNAGRATTHAA